MATYTEKELLKKIGDLCKKYDIDVKKTYTKKGEPKLVLFREGEKLRGPLIEYSTQHGKEIPQGYLSKIAEKLSNYLKHENIRLTQRTISKILKEKGQKGKKLLEEIVEGAAGAFIILAIVLMGFARNITSFAIYEKETINAPVVFLLISLGILLILLYYISRKI